MSYIDSAILYVCVGYGAPNASNNKENLMKMLHYPESATKNVSVAVGCDDCKKFKKIAQTSHLKIAYTVLYCSPLDELVEIYISTVIGIQMSRVW